MARRGLGGAALLLSLALAAPTSAAATAPPNDAFAAATPLGSAPTSAAGTTVGATREAGEPVHSGAPGGGTIWYRWTAPARGRVTFNSCSQAIHTLTVYVGSSLSSLIYVHGDDSLACNGGYDVELDAVKGETYRIALAQHSAYQAGTTELRVAFEAFPVPPNDDFADAALLVGPDGAANGVTGYATLEAGEPEHGGSPTPGSGASVWYRWQAPESGLARFDTCESGYDTVLGAYEGSEVSALTALARNDDAPAGTCHPTSVSALSFIEFDVVAGRSYRIAVAGPIEDTGNPARGWFRLAYSLDPRPAPGGGEGSGATTPPDPGTTEPGTMPTDPVEPVRVEAVEEPGPAESAACTKARQALAKAKAKLRKARGSAERKRARAKLKKAKAAAAKHCPPGTGGRR